MRGTCAVIVMVLMIVLAAHMQREENRRADEYDSHPASLRAGSGCHADANDDDPPPSLASVESTLR